MNLFKTIGIVKLFGGLVGLTDDQAKARRRCVEEVRKGVYQIISEVQFKAGEVIGLEKAPRVIEEVLESVVSGDPEDGAEDGAGDEVGLANLNYIAMAIYDLDEENPDHYTGKGVPKVGAIEEIVGFNVTAEQRDAAFALFQGE